MWGLNPQPQDQESHVPPTNPARDPKLRTFESAGNTQFLKKKKKIIRLRFSQVTQDLGLHSSFAIYYLCHLKPVIS